MNEYAPLMMASSRNTTQFSTQHIITRFP